MILYILISFLIYKKCIKIAYQNGKKKNPEEKPLYDLGHYYLPDLDDYHIIPDIILGFTLLHFYTLVILK